MCYSYQQGLDFGFAERSVVNPDIVDGAVEVEVRFGRSFSSDVQRLFGVGAQPMPPRSIQDSVHIQLMNAILENSGEVVPNSGYDRIDRAQIGYFDHPMPADPVSRGAELEDSAG